LSSRRLYITIIFIRNGMIFGSRTLYLKVLLADYDEHYVVIELFGEWNDADRE